MYLKSGSLDFSHEDLERAARYHRARYLAFPAGVGLSVAVYAVLAWSPVGQALWDLVSGLGWAGSAAAWAAIVVVIADLVQLPLAFWRGLIRERAWGFSRQSTGSWLADHGKGLAVGVVLTAAAWTAAVGLARWFPGWWPVAAGLVLALGVLVAAFVAPVVLEPLFNRFGPLEDEELAAELRALGERAGVPVRDVLVADASRRTTKHNAYVSGLGPTRRLVIYDTLLRDSPVPELRGVVAHELGHRRFSHVAHGTALAMLGAAAAVFALWVVFTWDGLVEAAGADGPGDPRIVPLALLVIWALEIGALPFETWLSRRWERAADRFAVELTHDPETMERMHRRLALANLADLDPPRPVYLLLFTHPTPPERIAAATMGT
jgi:STE24 endopeptidase